MLSRPTEQQPLLVSTRDAAKMLGICQRTLWTLTDRGDLPRVKFGQIVRYSVDDLRAFIARKREVGCE